MPRSRGIGVLGLLLALALIAAACGNDDDDTATAETGDTEAEATEAAEAEATATESASDAQLVLIYKSGTQQYFIDQADGAVAKAEELGLPEPRIVNVELDANLAINEVNNAIAAGAAGIGITAPDQAIGPAVAQAAAEAGIALVATDDGLEDEDGEPVPFVGFDGTDMGTKVGTAAAQLLNQAGWLDGGIRVGILSVEVETLSVCNDRTDAAKLVMGTDANVTDEMIVAVSYDGTVDSSLQATGPALTANNDITNWVVFACNDEGVKGALRALEGAGVEPAEIIGVGLGAYEACPEWNAGTDTGFKAALYISGRDVGASAVEVLYNHIVNGEPLPLNTVAPSTIVDPTTYEEVGVTCG